MSVMWNLWHGCHKLSEGCRNCYVYRGDSKRGIDSTVVAKTKSFGKPVERKKNGDYRIAPGTMVYTCFTSDFFIDDADLWRVEAWDMIRERRDLHFLMITKRIDRLAECVPADWGEGWEHVTICCTVEDQKMADYRLPIYHDAPVKHKRIICEPLLSAIDLTPWLDSRIGQVVAGGESGIEARPCEYEWIVALRQQCADRNIAFWFKQTGTYFIKDGIRYRIARQHQHSQARKSGLTFP